MAVEIDISIEESPSLDFALGTLQFVGIADHNQLTNRDGANQHPIGAIEGMTETLDDIRDAISDALKMLAECKASIDSINETLVLHHNELDEIDDTLTVYSETLDDYGESLKKHEEVLIEEHNAITELAAYTKNVATAEMIREVLDNV